MTITGPTVLAHPVDLPRAAKYAAEHRLALRLSDLIPRGQAFVIDPTKYPFIGEEKPA